MPMPLMVLLGALAPLMLPAGTAADASASALASYYERHMALVAGVAYLWQGRGEPRVVHRGVRQVGVGQEHGYVLLDDGTLLRLSDGPPQTLQRGLKSFAVGQSGWFGIDAQGVLWHATGAAAPQRIADDVVAAAIGDGADYYVRRDGTLWVRGLAHRGQYGDGKLASSPGFVNTAGGIVDVKAHTGHAIALQRDGVVIGTGGNRFGPLSTHGLGDKADRWGPIFDGAVAIATGSRHSLAIRGDGSLWAWGEGFGTAPKRLLDRVTVVAAGDSATLALGADGALWQWDGGAGPRRLALR